MRYFRGSMRAIIATTLLAVFTISRADIINYEYAEWSARGRNDDLFTFITRPDLTPPKLNAVFQNREKTAPGYIFVAPYDCLECSRTATTHYVTQQIGPVIYSQDGDLVWSGIALFPDKKVFDFRPVMINGEYHLAAISPQDAEWHPFADGAAMVLNSSYNLVHTLTSTDLGNRIDLHEFNILDDGRTVLIGVKEARDSTPADGGTWKGKVMESYTLEIDLQTREQRFLWKASDHVDLSESTNPPPRPGDQHQHWDWFHLNSIDKDANGNYLISARATNTIYLISPNGAILWRLGGGINSSFQQDFNFSRQHHARIRKEGRTSMVISFFDNADDDSGHYVPTSSESSVLIVALNFETMQATLNHRHPRPDGGFSQAKGNVQFLHNGGVLAGWGENAYMTEYAQPGGQMVYEASFASTRFANYRAYKMDFVAQPTSAEFVTKAFASANSQGDLGTSIYVSWNGATEVAQWRFYSRNAKRGVVTIDFIGSAYKTGFETAFLASGYHPIVFAEALDVKGTSLANSTLSVTELPLGFHNPMNPLLSSTQRARIDESDLVLRTVIAFLAGIVVTVALSQFRNSRHNFVGRAGSLRWTSRKGR